MNLGNVLAKLRKEKGLNQRDFAESLGVSNGTVAMWETNKRQPDLEMLVKIARYYCVSIDYLLGNDQFSEKDSTSPIPTEDSKLLKYFHKINSTDAFSENDLQIIFRLCPRAKNLPPEDHEGKIVLGDKIRNLRVSHKYTQEDLALKIKVSKSAIGMYEQNRRSPDLETLLKLSDIFEVSVDYLLGKDTHTTPSTNRSIPAEDDRLLKYFHKIKEAETLSDAECETLTKFFPGAKYLTAEDQELLDYYHELSKKDQRWIMGQMIDLIKKADEQASDIPKAQGS